MVVHNTRPLNTLGRRGETPVNNEVAQSLGLAPLRNEMFSRFSFYLSTREGQNQYGRATYFEGFVSSEPQRKFGRAQEAAHMGRTGLCREQAGTRGKHSGKTIQPLILVIEYRSSPRPSFINRRPFVFFYFLPRRKLLVRAQKRKTEGLFRRGRNKSA